MAMNIPFVGFQPVTTSEHMAGFGVFGLLQLVGFMSYLEPKLGRENVKRLFKFILLTVIGLGISAIIARVSIIKIFFHDKGVGFLGWTPLSKLSPPQDIFTHGTGVFTRCGILAMQSFTCH